MTDAGGVFIFDAKARSCPSCHSIGPPKDGCEHPWHQVSAPGHAGYQHRGDHGWGAHDGHPLHQHHPITGRIRWATDDEIRRLKQEVPPSPFLDPVVVGHPEITGTMPRTCPAASGGNVIVTCTLGCGSELCTMQERDQRCPDRGYCHGSTLEASSSPCEPSKCYRVTTSGPLSGVFPGDRWPREVLIANGAPDPDSPLRKTTGIAMELCRCLGVAIGAEQEDADAVKAHLALAAQSAKVVIELLVQANHELTGQDELHFQGWIYTADGRIILRA